jgi:prevent-host-death family protein
MIVNVSEAKTNLSKLIDMAYQGEEVIIAKNNLSLVVLLSSWCRTNPGESASSVCWRDRFEFQMTFWMKMRKSMPCSMETASENFD